MKERLQVLAITLSVVVPGPLLFAQPTSQEKAASVVTLPAPRATGSVSVEEAIAKRRTVRAFTSAPLTLAELSQLLWAAQGITDPVRQHRAAPSAGALYPLEVVVVVGNVTGLASGSYRYQARGHQLNLERGGDLREELAAAALHQEWLAKAPVVLVIAAVYERTSGKYGDRSARYVPMEVGHAAENVALEAVALGLGAGLVGAFEDVAVARVVGLAPREKPLYLVPAGRP